MSVKPSEMFDVGFVSDVKEIARHFGKHGNPSAQFTCHCLLAARDFLRDMRARNTAKDFENMTVHEIIALVEAS